MKRFLIGQLACFGDCLYATTVARQIKNDYPDSHITWAVATKYKSILNLNPHVDELWEIELINNDYFDLGWKSFEAEANLRKSNGIYDELIFTQLAKEHWIKYDGTIRSSTLRGYNKPITVSVDPVIRLSEDEIKRVGDFAQKANLPSFREVVLFEYAPGSGQSFITVEFALQLARKITSMNKQVCFVFSGPTVIPFANSQIIDASNLTFRENAELTKYCTLLIGCSSGITWLSTSDWSRKLKMVQLLNRNYEIFAGVKYDFEYWGLPAHEVIEITKPDVDHVTDCINTILDKDFESAKALFDEIYKPGYINFRSIIYHTLPIFKDHIFLIFSLIKGYHKRNKHLRFGHLLYHAFQEVKPFYKARLRMTVKHLVPRFNRLNNNS